MINQPTNLIEKKKIAILKILSDSQHPLGSRILAHRLHDLGIDLGERAVRYHLKLMDERGLTQPAGHKDGRSITRLGLEEINNALVNDRVGLMTTKICTLSYMSSFELGKRDGKIPINVSLCPEKAFNRALKIMMGAFQAGLGLGRFVAVAYEGEKLGQVIVPQGKIGLATISQTIVCGILLKAGIMPDVRFGGILELRNYEPRRFVDVIEYNGSSLDPSEIFIAGKFTSVNKVIKNGSGKLLASFWEIPASTRPNVEAIIEELMIADINGIIILGKTNQPFCELPVAANKVGMVLSDGLNPVAAAVEAGIEVENHTMSGTMDFEQLENIQDYNLTRK